MPSLTAVSQEISIYFGIFVFITGTIGGCFNLIVFLSLKTFRKNACVFYLTILSIVNIGILITGQLTRILISGYNIDWTQTSLFYCKFRIYSLQTSTLISMTCSCLAILDQYFSTSLSLRYRQLSQIKIAHCVCGLFVSFWAVVNCPYLIYYTHIQFPSVENQITCSTTNNAFLQYVNYVSAIALGRIIPLIIMGIFGFLSHKNIQRLSHRTLPIIRRELDKQLTLMIFTQAIVACLIISPYIVLYFVMMIPNLDSITLTQLKFVSSLCSAIYYLYFSVRTLKLLRELPKRF